MALPFNAEKFYQTNQRDGIIISAYYVMQRIPRQWQFADLLRHKYFEEGTHMQIDLRGFWKRDPQIVLEHDSSSAALIHFVFFLL